MAKVHLIAGPNNSGKSNVLEVAQRILPALRDGSRPELSNIDRPLGLTSEDGSELRVSIRTPLSDDELSSMVEGRSQFSPQRVRSILQGEDIHNPDGFWFEYELSDQRGWQVSHRQADEIDRRAESSGIRNPQQWLQNLSQRFGGGSGRSAGHKVLQGLSERLDVTGAIPEVAAIGAFRRITPGAGSDVVEDEHNGPGLIERLNQLQSPGFDGDRDRERFARINHFLQSLLDDDAARIQIPHDKETINVFHAGQWLPLANYGTGLHEVIILAAAATVLSNRLVCIEEPEIHLHPTLQRKLLRYLDEETENQYLIATHSAHLLDFGRASISASRLVDGGSELSPVIEKADVAAISFGLGARASDLVQANSVIWVEGPSDRIYVRAWIAALDNTLTEGIDFSILIYGGRLLRHLSADDEAVEEFVKLPQVNRHFGLMMDSDRKGPRKALGATKDRIRREIRAYSDAFVWVTQGYTIENYVPSGQLATAVTTVHPEADPRWEGEQFVNPLAPENIGGRLTPVDKVAIANAVVSHSQFGTEWPLDLRRQVKGLVRMVHLAK